MRTKMKKKTAHAANVAAAILLALAVCLGLQPGGGLTVAHAQSAAPDNPKLSADLDQLFNQDPDSGAKVRVVVETPVARGYWSVAEDECHPGRADYGRKQTDVEVWEYLKGANDAAMRMRA